jgi:GxxExxY protein
MEENEIGRRIIGCAIELHCDLGPGLLESAYQVLLADILIKQGLKVERQVVIPIRYQEIQFDEGFRADLIVATKVIVELKSVEHLNNAHKKQVLTYLKLSGLKLGYLLNLGEGLMKNGISRIVNGHDG